VGSFTLRDPAAGSALRDADNDMLRAESFVPPPPPLPPGVGIPQLIVELDLGPFITAPRLDVASLDSGFVLDYESPTFSEDISQFVEVARQPVTIDRGARREQQRVEAGEVSFDLRNNDARFTPLNPASPYYPNILPMRRIRFKAVWLGVTYVIFTAFIEEWPVSFVDPVNQIVRVRAVDGTTVLSWAGVSGSFPAQTSGERVAAILAAADWPLVETDIDTGNVTVPEATLENASALEHIHKIEKAEGGRFFIDRFGKATFRRRPVAQIPSVTWANDGSGLPYGDDVVLKFGSELILNDIHFTREGGVEQIAESIDSQREFGKRSVADTDVQLNSDAQVAALGDEHLFRYAEPVLRLESLTDRATRHGQWDQVLDREISDVVLAVEERNDVSQVSTVEGRHDEIGAVSWSISFDLSPTTVNKVAVLDDPVLGLLDSDNLLGR
jgi:hypothetical protein